MAYFIVIGTNNDVKGVVDEIKHAHLQHNVITSGCIHSEGEDKYYHWDVFNEQGHKTKENNEPIALHDALTNQIAHFKTLLPDDVIPNVFILSKCFDAEESDTLHMVYEELCQIGGATLCGIQVDIVLIGYDLKRSDDVTQRPHWRVLESLRGLAVQNHFHTNILYINNMDYMGAATNVDSRVLGKFLCHWSKMVCSGGYDPKATVNSNVYSIGMSEHQYDFRDLNDFFKLSAEERLLDRTLYGTPSSDTQALLDFNYYKKIDLGLPWIDGLCTIQNSWKGYCSTDWDSSKSLSDNPYSLSRQEQEIASYLNKFLSLYNIQENREIAQINSEIAEIQTEIEALSENLTSLDDQDDQPEYDNTQEKISHLQSEIDEKHKCIKKHEDNIKRNTFFDADTFYTNFGTVQCITDEDELNYNSNQATVGRMIEYLKSDDGITVMREAIDRAVVEDILPQPYPAKAISNVGRAVETELAPDQIPVLPISGEPIMESDELSKRPGCLAWFVGLFKKDSSDEPQTIVSEPGAKEYTSINADTKKFLTESLNRAVSELKRVDDIRGWWTDLCQLIDKHKMRIAECIFNMDGEKNINGDYLNGREGYRPKSHRKSVSLIEMDKVRIFRDNDSYYKQMVGKFLDRWFNSTIPVDSRMTMPELIKHQVLDPLVGRFHTLKWDGGNPFVDEEISDKKMHDYIDHDIRHSKPFVEYVRIQDSNIGSNLNVGFFSNNPNVPVDANVFRSKYQVGSNSINPVYLEDFPNSLCVIQVMDIPDHIDALKDFKPRRDAELSRLRTDITAEVTSIIGNAVTVEEKARAIYDWICDNIAYDTTMQIFDAETCWKTRRGVCRAYCELFCHMAEIAGLTADIVSGKIKTPDGKVAEDKHAWIFVYTHAYEGLLIDPTWGAGAICDGKFIKSNDKSMWFNVSPYWMAFSHFPDQDYWTKLDINITEGQFESLPYLVPSNDSDGKDVLFESLSKL